MPFVNVSKKDLSKVIRDFERLPYQSYEKNRPKNDPTYSYFYLARQLVKWIEPPYLLKELGYICY